jgi:hypothetical protein
MDGMQIFRLDNMCGPCGLTAQILGHPEGARHNQTETLPTLSLYTVLLGAPEAETKSRFFARVADTCKSDLSDSSTFRRKTGSGAISSSRFGGTTPSFTSTIATASNSSPFARCIVPIRRPDLVRSSALRLWRMTTSYPLLRSISVLTISLVRPRMHVSSSKIFHHPYISQAIRPRP